MAKTLEKTRKQIAKKRNGNIGSLHEGSRDSRRLHKAHVRDERLGKQAQTRKKSERPYLDRVSHFQQAIRDNDSKPLSMESVHEHIKTLVQEYDEEFDEVKKARRPGRPASAREDLLKVKVTALQKEYTNGFLMPDLTTQDNVSMLDRWDGSWTFLNTLSWVRITQAGASRPSSFPPKGDH